ncbi:hypothetical protein E3E12_01050 [Formicincola oecophyllae]|uniref:UDP-3-O-acyl-N-acetylglucosamine deacetylase n=1 Tax=Formicincola oecophyllae TaxID=2558361 RepID=A0A4Y6UA33_9PROT|nr:UDP-3-O-acyl-N-acetylglucosamine deacetylase [Formicincola oecophyllae]QDH13015.1 hypothetical protein E3E12_01050 [Formicincola oecophyllae]
MNAFKSSWQHTLSHAVQGWGVGLHSGAAVCVTLQPMPVDSGLWLEHVPPASPKRFFRLSPKTCRGGFMATQAVAPGKGAGVEGVGTLEHLLAACHLVGLDNVNITVEGPEIPILDGGAWLWVQMLQTAGLVKQPSKRCLTRPTSKIRVEAAHGQAWLEAHPPLPGQEGVLSLSLTIDFPHEAIGRQRAFLVLGQRSASEPLLGTPPTQPKTMAASRTFVERGAIVALQSSGRALGGSLAHALVADESSGTVINPGGVRWGGQEFVHHKLLDLLGDLYTTGNAVRGRFEGFCSGHRLNGALVQALAQQAPMWPTCTKM